MFGWLVKIFGVSVPGRGEPIRLEFECDHYIENISPPLMQEEDRKRAQNQAERTPCPNCDESLWRGLALENVYPELRAALTVVGR